MPHARVVHLTEQQEHELRDLLAHDRHPDLRTKAAAILKVAAGQSILQVAKQGLLRPYDDNTVRAWITRYLDEGIPGLRIRPGRGRKPAFFPYRHG